MATINGTTNPDTITGTIDWDEIHGLAGSDTILGGVGYDTIFGDDGDDWLETGDSEYEWNGVEILHGGAGNDTLIGQSEYTSLYGDDGDDLLIGADFELIYWVTIDNLYGGNGNDTLIGGLGFDNLTGGAGNDYYVIHEEFDDDGFYYDTYTGFTDDIFEDANGGRDTVEAWLSFALPANFEDLVLKAGASGTGNAVANLITAHNGGASLSGLAGNDTLIGGTGNDTLDGGLGNDSMTGGLGNDLYVVNYSTDIITEAAGGGTDTVRSSTNWTLAATFEHLELTGGATHGTGNSGANRITGSILGNRLIGGDGNDTLDGGGGNDELFGDAGNDSMIGGAGADTFEGGAGADTMNGGANGDSFTVRDAGDLVVEALNEGTDTVTAYISYTLTPNVEKLILFGAAAINGVGNDLGNTLTGSYVANTLSGGLGNDTLYGAGGGDTLNGDAGVDTLNGDAGADRLNGGDANDMLRGGAGRDVLSGGLGADRFIWDDGEFGLSSTVGADLIIDFSVAEGDKIDLALVDANATSAATDEAFTFIGSAAFSGIAGQLRFEVIAGNTYVQGDTNGDSVADLWIGLTGTPALLASHFML